MPKLTGITKYTDMNTFLTIAEFKALATSAGAIRNSLTELKTNLEALLEDGKGFDLDSFVIEGEPIIHNELLRQIKNIEMLIQDMQYEEWRIFERGKWHRTRELEIYIEKLENAIETHENEKPKEVDPAGSRINYTTYDEYRSAINARTIYMNKYNAWKKVSDDLVTKKTTAESWKKTTEAETFSSLKYVENLNNIKGGSL